MRFENKAVNWDEKPWKTVDLVEHELDQMIAYLTPDERQLFHWVAANAYSGFGEIIDAGAFLGGSARCFATGLIKGNFEGHCGGRIHSYDLYRYYNWISDKIEALRGCSPGDSFVNLFHQTLGVDAEKYVTVYPGNLTDRDWDGRPVEILMIDCAKTRALGDKCLSMFFPHLKKGSLVIHQDYAVASRLYWIHSSMYLLRDYIEYSGVVDRGGSAVFTVLKEIPDSKIQSVIGTIHSGDLPDLALEAAEFMSRYSPRFEEIIKHAVSGFLESPIA